MSLNFKLILLSLFIFGHLFSSGLMADEEATESSADIAQLLQLLKSQQLQIKALEKRLDQLSQQVENTDSKVEATVEIIESNISGTPKSTTQLGGYGELHYTQNQDQSQLDFHRFVLFVGHDFSDSVRFYSELEVEHAIAGNNQVGAVELEQAFIEMDLTQDSRLKTGLFLMPIGIINETHEPTSFYGVERNAVEKHIIPTTWAETGAWLSTQLTLGFNLDFAVHSGLKVPVSGNQAFLIRNGRQKGAKANASALAYTGRIKYTAIPGLELAASYQYQEDLTHTLDPSPASLWSAHIAYQKGPYALRALYAKWEIDNLNAETLGRNKQQGYYLEPSYKFNEQLGLFVRWSQWDNNAGNDFDSAIDQTNLGLNYWPMEDVVFKIDYQEQRGRQNDQGLNLGMGYQF